MIKFQRERRFKFMLLWAALFLLPLMVSLGFWQLSRAEEKQTLIASWDTRAVLTTLAAGMKSITGMFVPVLLEGRLESKRYFLLDNRTRRGQPGYEVIAIFHEANSGESAIVNLGWVALGRTRDDLPDVNIPQTMLVVSGRMRSLGKSITLKDTPVNDGWPKVIQRLDLDVVSDFVGKPIIPAVVRIDEPLLKALDINWPILTMLPEKHLGYAFQWFAMSVALFVMIIWSVFQIKKDAYE